MGRLLDYFENKWPYTDFHELNADWLISTVKEIIEIVDNFVSTNTIKYADPIEWDITRQYEANTIVVDPVSGNAYLSTKPVPSGINITNEDYWTIIFNYQTVIDNIKHSICAVDEGSNTTASADRKRGDMLWINNRLVIITRDILAGTAYIEKTDTSQVTGNYVYRTVTEQIESSYNSDNKRLTIHARVNPSASILSRGDYHVYDGARQAIKILEVE